MYGLVTAQQLRQAAALTPWAHPRKLLKGTDEDVTTESPCEIRPVRLISDSRHFACFACLMRNILSRTPSLFGRGGGKSVEG